MRHFFLNLITYAWGYHEDIYNSPILNIGLSCDQLKALDCQHFRDIIPVNTVHTFIYINTKHMHNQKRSNDKRNIISCNFHGSYPLPGPSLGDPAPSLVRAAISRTRRAARGSFSFPLSARAVGLRLRIRYRLFRRHQAPSSWKFW